MVGKGSHRYTAFHWGFAPRARREVHIPGVPKAVALIQIGQLLDLRVKAPGVDFEIEAPPGVDIAFDERNDRIYIIPTRKFQQACREELWLDPRRRDVQTALLPEVARAAGGAQATNGAYPRIPVQALGRLHHVAYRTAKYDPRGEDGTDDPDDPDDFQHEVGEVSGIRPYLCVDSSGRLWLAGGNYTCPDDGITD